MIDIRVIDHRSGDFQPEGRIIRPWIWDATKPPGPEYTDYAALFDAAHNYIVPPRFIGFFGYRKYLWLPGYMFMPDPAHNPDWWSLGETEFDAYRTQLAADTGANLLPLLAMHDVLIAPPFQTYHPIVEDFAISRSVLDAMTLSKVLEKFKLSEDVKRIYPWLTIMRWEVFVRMMGELEPIRQELHGKCTGEDSKNDEYKKRPMAYVMERVFSLWLETSGLALKEMPLLHCWNKSEESVKRASQAAKITHPQHTPSHFGPPGLEPLP